MFVSWVSFTRLLFRFFFFFSVLKKRDPHVTITLCYFFIYIYMLMYIFTLMIQDEEVQKFHKNMGYEKIFIEELNKDKNKEKEKKARYEKQMIQAAGIFNSNNDPNSNLPPIVVVVAKPKPTPKQQGYTSLQKSKEQAEEILKKEKQALLFFCDNAGRLYSIFQVLFHEVSS
jgi:hypothetical protein